MYAEELTREVRSRILGPFSVSVGIGETVALVGTNGSGKTTLIRLLLGLDRASSGSVRVFGHPVSPLLPPKGIGYVPDAPQFWDWRSAMANISPFCSDPISGPAILERVGLGHTGKTPVKKFSRGMRQRLAIARALARSPRLLVLDEPTIALDASGVDMLTGFLRETQQSGTSVLVASHDSHFLNDLGCPQVTVRDAKTVSGQRMEYSC